MKQFANLIVRTTALSVALVVASVVGAQDAFIESTRLLPDTTQGFVVIDDLTELESAWHRVSMGKLLETSEMQPIQESLRTSIDNWLVQQGGNVSIRLEDLGRITTGQLVLAWLSSSELRHPYRICLLADTRGQDALTKDAIERAEGDLKKRGATLKKETIDGQEVHVYTMPTKPGHLDIDQVAYCRADGRLIISDRWTQSKIFSPPSKPVVLKRQYSIQMITQPYKR